MMRFARSLVLCLVVTSSVPLIAWGQSSELRSDLELGPAVLIGSLPREVEAPQLLPEDPEARQIIPVSAEVESEPGDDQPLVPNPVAAPSPYVGMLPIRVIGHPMPAPVADPLLALGPVNEPVHPDQIQAHLSAAAAQLALAGLFSESQKIVEFQHQFQREHSQRLLIVYKESQLRALQAEIEYLKLSSRSVADDSLPQLSPVVSPVSLSPAPFPMPPLEASIEPLRLKR